ncbi:MAG TPA: TonB-dependent receptor, partial [Candidatus Limnocylindria bacterium]|nr:TonB-dependent receptor [Candidatus Limnocylindria bacterium]
GVEGRQDLQVAATRELQRSLLRSYLGKAWSHTWDAARAEKELGLAKKFDPNDPTPWLYSAILAEQQNRMNEAVSDLEKSQELNENRSVFRSRLLLDQDKAVRSANLARIYQDAGMIDWSLREGIRAVSYNYANFSAHQFLANSYTALRDPKQINLRYEAPALSEYFIASLLSPVGATPLSQTVSQQEYTRLFDRDHFGVASSTEYFSSGDWVQAGSQYGRYGNMDYSLDAFYRTDKGQRPNNDLERTEFAGRFRQQITPQDTLYFEAQRSESDSGDLAQYYNQTNASRTLRAKEVQEPNLFLGYHREWNPGVHTLFLGSRFEDDLQIRDPNYPIYFFRYSDGVVVSNRSETVRDPMRFRTDLEAYSAELQQIFSVPKNTLIIGGRFQYGFSDTFNSVISAVTNAGQIDFRTKNRTELVRQSIYAYDQWSPWQPVQFTVGIAYDRLNYPDNIDIAPISGSESSKDQISPKAGVIWTVDDRTHVRAAYTRSLGGVFFDNSFRLEPTQVGGFNQSFRSVAPESAVGQVPGTRFETYGVGVDHRLPTRTYLNADAEVLNSKATRTFGVLTNSIFLPVPDRASSARQKIEYEERSFTVSVNQLVGRDWAFGVRYRISDAELKSRFPVISDAVGRATGFNRDTEATLQQLSLSAIYNLPCGFFANGEAIWTAQNNRGDTSDLEDDCFWQLNVFVGYRFWRRRAEARVGLLNVTDQDYRLSPVNLYTELPRERTFYASFKFYF